MDFLVTLKETERETKKGISISINFTIPKTKIDELELAEGDLIQILVGGVFSEPAQNEQEIVDISIPGRVVKAGGGSYQMTIPANYVKRYRRYFKGEHDMLIKEIKIRKKAKKKA